MPLDLRELQAQDPNDRGLINLESYTSDSFTIFGYQLSTLLDDTMLVKYVDMTDDGKSLVRNGIHIPINTMQKAWRIGQVILSGMKCREVQKGDFVCFPHDKGVPVSNLDVEGVGLVRDAIFLNEDRIFGVCKPKENPDDGNTRKSKKRTRSKRSGN
tara:strand:+ start:7215 stop:7685 length:471 start_codon:yes stop_codon:yes gene_type:complete